MSLDIDGSVVDWERIRTAAELGPAMDEWTRELQDATVHKDWLGLDVFVLEFTDLWAWMRRDLPKAVTSPIEKAFQGFLFVPSETWTKDPINELVGIDDECLYAALSPRSVGRLHKAWETMELESIRESFEVLLCRRYIDDPDTRRKEPRFEERDAKELYTSSWGAFVEGLHPWRNILKRTCELKQGLLLHMG